MMFPALNITGIARVELSTRDNLDRLMQEALEVYDAINSARRKSGAAEIYNATVCSMSKPLFSIASRRGGRGRVVGKLGGGRV